MNKIIDQNRKSVLQEAVCNRCKCDYSDNLTARLATFPRDAKGFIPLLIAPPGVGKAFWREDLKEINSLECTKGEEQNEETLRSYFKGGNENE